MRKNNQANKIAFGDNLPAIFSPSCRYNFRRGNNIFLVRFIYVMAAVLLMTVGISVAEEDKKEGKLTEEHKISINNKDKKKVVKAPDNFTATEEVSADQAVAFPTDI